MINTEKRRKILVLSDHPLVPSGVGIQTKYLIEGLLRTGKYKFVCMGGAIKHPNKNIQHVSPDVFGEKNWIIYPVDNHGTKEELRAFLDEEKPDAVLLVTDPRFFIWVWEMEDEIRSICPIVYWHVWDNDPPPSYNNVFYHSTDAIGCISLKTYGILQALNYPKDRFSYIPHALPDQLFKPLPTDEIEKFRHEHFGPFADTKFVVFWNNRNARRKSTGDVIAAFAKFAKIVGRENVALFMHTAPYDEEGQNVFKVAEEFNIKDRLLISDKRVPPEALNSLYNACDATINIASNEGFGLSTLESLYSGTPIIVHMTGGLQFQVGDWWSKLKDFSNQDKMFEGAKKRFIDRSSSWFGIPVFPASRSCTGSQNIPFIYDDRVSHNDVVDAFIKLYDMGKDERKKMGQAGREFVLKNFNMDDMISKWDELLECTLDSFVLTKVRKCEI